MKYDIITDIKTVLTLLDLSSSQLAEELGVARSTVIRILNKQTYPSDLFLESFYSYAYTNKHRQIRLNDLKIQFCKDKYDRILFHGAKDEIVMPIDLNHSRKQIDVGVGFYLGESYEQASSYIFANKKSCVYLFDSFYLDSLKVKEFSVSLEWMLMVCYYREQIDRFKNSKKVQNIIKEIEECDVIIAPIADNNMYELMGQFARGLITDEQAISALSASSLGKQHVIKSQRACYTISPVDRLYLCEAERRDIEKKQMMAAQLASDKYKLAIENNRRKGKYIEELLNE